MKMIITTLAFILMAVSPFTVMAQDEGLYDPVAPDGSAFVRFIHQGHDNAALKPTLNGKTYQPLAHGTLSAYVPVKEGPLNVKIGSSKLSETAISGAYYTLALNDDDLILFSDPIVTNPVKSMITFYNLSHQSAAIKTADGKIEIIPSIKSGKQGHRDINPLPVELAIFDGTKNIADIGVIHLKRNQPTSIILSSNADGTFTVITTQSTTDTKQ